MEDGNRMGRGELPTGRLGFAIVSDIIRMHSGALRVRSNVAGGTGVSSSWEPAASVQA